MNNLFTSTACFLMVISIILSGDSRNVTFAFPHSYAVDNDCLRFVLGETCTEGFGDQLEHYIYSLYIAKLLNATVITDGFATGPAKHIRTDEYAKVAEKLLGIDFTVTAKTVMDKYHPKIRTVSYDDAVTMYQQMRSTPCNSFIISDITSCGRTWCHAVRQFDSLRDTIWMLRNNHSLAICNEWRQNVSLSDAERNSNTSKNPSVVRVVWHVRSGDICLHCNDADYFKRTHRLLQTALEGYNFTVTFESQYSVPEIEQLFPEHTFRINSSLIDTSCDIISSDILITSGSSLPPLIAAVGGSPWHPIVFEEIMKNFYVNDVTHHFFAYDEAILLNSSIPYATLNEITTAVRSVLSETFGPPTGALASAYEESSHLNRSSQMLRSKENM